jgi:GrpB-like predicted nucleotidyltransferase (UPF0157 family)
MILGLSRGEIRLVAHQPGWGAAFTNEKEQLARILKPPALMIEHVGSTAVRGLAAKPILDIAVAVSSLEDTHAWPDLLRGLDYTFFGDREGWGEHFYAKGPDQNRTIYLHVVPIGNSRWSDYLVFRDALRARTELRQEYENLKQRLLAQHGDDRPAYTDAKAALIRRVLDERKHP